MKLISCHRGKIQHIAKYGLMPTQTRPFSTGLRAIDWMLAGGAFPCGAIHEILSQEGEGLPLFFAAILASSAGKQGAVVWCDRGGRLYPPALEAAGIGLERLFLLRPSNAADELWAVAECLRCRGVSVTVATLGRLSRIDARRLQLAAERGGGTGILLRPSGALSAEYAAATRWLVRPIPGERLVQRWQLQLIHGHGGRVGQSAILEVSRETDHVRALETVGDRSAQKEAIRKRA